MIRTIADKRLRYVMATEAEYGPYLSSLFLPLMIGVGPMEASINLTRVLAVLEQQGELPDLVISIGSAGSTKLEQTEVYQVSSVAYRDMDASPLGFEKGRTPFLDLPKSIELPCLLPNLPTATLSTGANIVSGKAYDDIDADMVDMETFACLRVCQTFGVGLSACVAYPMVRANCAMSVTGPSISMSLTKKWLVSLSNWRQLFWKES